MARVLVRGGRVIDGVATEAIDEGYVLWDGERIVEVGAVSELGDRRDFDRTIDATGKTVIPGLVNAHEHLDDRRTFGPYHERVTRPAEMLLIAAVRATLLSLAEGFTSVRDVGAHHSNSLYLKHAYELGVLVGPRIKTCIAPISQTGSSGLPTSVPATGVDEVRRVTRDLLYRGADFIKCQASSGAAGARAGGPTAVEMSLPELATAFEEAHKVGKKTTVHAHPPAAIKQAIDAGVDAIEHGCLIDDATASLMAERRVVLVCTLSEFEVTGREGVAYRRPKLQVERNKPLAELAVENFGRAVRAGVPIAWGLDVLGNPVREFELMIEGGMTPMEAIHAATRAGAELMDMANDIGTLEPNKYADIVILDGNPLEDPKAIGRVERVVMGGREIDKAGIEPVIGEQLPGYLIDHGRLLAAEEYT